MKKIRFELLGSFVAGLLALSPFLGCGPSTGAAPTDDAASVGGSGGGGTGGSKQTGGTGGMTTGGTGGSATGGTGGTATGGTGGSRDASATGGTGGNRDASATGGTGGTRDASATGGTGGTRDASATGGTGGTRDASATGGTGGTATGGSGGGGTGGTGGATGGTGGTTTGSIIVATAGDIGNCSSKQNTADVAKVMQALKPALFLSLGDHAYPDGTAAEFRDCYHNLGWGEFKSITRPSPGNHEYHTNQAAPYYDYFGAQAGPSGRGYYSFDQGNWHFVSLNGEVDMDAGSPQHKWLVSDLAANQKDCIIFYQHRALFASNTNHGSNKNVLPLFTELYKAGAEIAVGAHDHYYERFAPQDPSGKADNAYGIRQFIVGTGGAGLNTGFSKLPNSEVINVDSKGVLKLTLGAGTYSWEFLPMAGRTLKDSGSGTCHGKP